MILLIHLLYVIKFLNNPVSSNFYFKKIFLLSRMLSSHLCCFPNGCSIYGGQEYMLQGPSNEMYLLAVQMLAWVHALDKSKLMRTVMAQHSLSYLVNSERRKIKKMCIFGSYEF